MSRASLLGVALLLGSTDMLLAQKETAATAPADRASLSTAADPTGARAKTPATAAARAEYRQRRSSIANAGGSAEILSRRLELALWCEQHGLQNEMREQARAVVASDPEHGTARRLLGHEQVDGKWCTHEEAMQARGYVQHRGQWMRKYDAFVLQSREEEARARERERVQLQRELNDQFRRLASSSPATRNQALAAIEALAERRGWSELSALGRKQKALCDVFWQQHQVTATLQLQHAELLSLTPFTTSLGVGSPVTLQLPQMRTTSIATTVVLPAGSSR